MSIYLAIDILAHGIWRDTDINAGKRPLTPEPEITEPSREPMQQSSDLKAEQSLRPHDDRLTSTFLTETAMAALHTPSPLDSSTDAMPDSRTHSIPDSLDDFECDLDELETAEDFLDYFGVHFEPSIVHVNRLHILQRFHDYLAEVDELPDSAAARYRLYADLLQGAYQDFVGSDARTEKVFRVFKMQEPRQVNVGLDQLLASASRNAPASLTEQPL